MRARAVDDQFHLIVCRVGIQCDVVQIDGLGNAYPVFVFQFDTVAQIFNRNAQVNDVIDVCWIFVTADVQTRLKIPLVNDLQLTADDVRCDGSEYRFVAVEIFVWSQITGFVGVPRHAAIGGMHQELVAVVLRTGGEALHDGRVCHVQVAGGV